MRLKWSEADAGEVPPPRIFDIELWFEEIGMDYTKTRETFPGERGLERWKPRFW